MVEKNRTTREITSAILTSSSSSFTHLYDISSCMNYEKYELSVCSVFCFLHTLKNAVLHLILNCCECLA